MYDLREIWNSLGALHELIDAATRNPVDARRQHHELLTLRNEGDRLPLDEHSSVSDSRVPLQTSLRGMNRWLPIQFSKAASELVGSFGTAVLVSDVLRWNALGPNADYCARLALLLDLESTPRPIVDDPSTGYLSDLASWMRIVDVIQSSNERWERDVLTHVYLSARDAFFRVERGSTNKIATISYPADFLPPPSEAGVVSQELATPIGGVLRAASEEAGYLTASEREKLKRALPFYPDEDIEVEVERNGEKTFTLYSPVLEGTMFPLEEIMEPPIGSVCLDHYGPDSCFSPDPTHFEYRLHLPAEQSESEYVGQCFLSSDLVTYTASVELND